MSSSDAELVGFVGLGIMGLGMCNNLVTKAGRRVVVWNRSQDKALEFAERHGSMVQVAATPKEVVERCRVTFCMLSTLEASEACFEGSEGVLAGVCEGKAIVDCATLTAERMRVERDQINARGGTFLEAPVSGTKAPAEQGTLIFMCAGDKQLFDDISVELDVMGKAKHFLGEVGNASNMKLVVNMIMGGMMTCLSEGMALCSGADLSVDELLTIVDQGAMSCPLFKLKGPKIMSGNFQAAFPLKHQQKDLRFALALGDEVGVSLPVSAAANETFIRARPSHGEEDMCAVYEVVKPSKLADDTAGEAK